LLGPLEYQSGNLGALHRDKRFDGRTPLVGFERNRISVNLRLMTRLLRFFLPSHQHTAFSATLLLMGAVVLAWCMAYIREAYIA